MSTVPVHHTSSLIESFRFEEDDTHEKERVLDDSTRARTCTRTRTDPTSFTVDSVRVPVGIDQGQQVDGNNDDMNMDMDIVLIQPNPYTSDTDDATTEEIQSMRSTTSQNEHSNIITTCEKWYRGGEVKMGALTETTTSSTTCSTTASTSSSSASKSVSANDTITVATIQSNHHNIEENGIETHPMISDTGVQSVPRSNSTSSQTHWRRKVNKITQYQTLELEDFGYDSDLVRQREDDQRVAESLQRVAPLFERALQQNEIVDIFSSYLDLPDKGDMSNFRRVEVDDGLIEVRNFTDLEYSKGKHIQYIGIHPTRRDIIAASVCDPASMDDIIPLSGVPKYSHIIVWQFGLQMRPLWILRAPLDCPVFCFSPTQPNIIVGGCRNGQMVMWDTEGASSLDQPPLFEPGHHSIEPEKRTSAISKEMRSNTVLLPKALSFPEHGHKLMIHDITWLPPNIHINAKGDLLEEEYLSDISHQFFTVSGDGQIIFWDIRYHQIMRGELPFIAKMKSTRHVNVQEEDGDFPSLRWMPIFKIKPKRLEGTGELSLCRAFKVLGPTGADRSSEIICASEEGDLLSVDWCPKRESKQDDSGKELDRDFASQEYVQWMKKDHDINRPCVSLCPVTFFPSFLLTASDWNFHIWETNDKKTANLLFTSADAASYITGAKWSPKRPGVLFVSKVDGSIDIWDFTESCYAPHTTIPLVPTCIVSMEFLVGPKDDSQMLAIGDSAGTLHIFEIPQNLAQPYPNEFQSMKGWLDREVQIRQSHEISCESVSEQYATEEMPNFGGSKVQQNKVEDEVQDGKELLGLTDEENAEYLAFESSFR